MIWSRGSSAPSARRLTQRHAVRVRILQATILVFGFFTVLSGFAQNFTQLFICRALQGLGFGGGWAPAPC